MVDNKVLSEILKEVKELRKSYDITVKANAKLLHKNDVIEEMLNLTVRLVSDLSAKKDLELCAMGIKQTDPGSKNNAKAANSTEETKKMNIRMYFKHKWKTDPKTIYTIVDEKTCAELLEKNKVSLKDKKGDAIKSAEAEILYKEYFNQGSNNQRILRSIKEAEENSSKKLSKEISENKIVKSPRVRDGGTAVIVGANAAITDADGDDADTHVGASANAEDSDTDIDESDADTEIEESESEED